MESTHQRRFRESASRLPSPVVLDDAPRAIPGQQGLALAAAGYREADAAWLRAMITTNGLGPEGSR